jgi:hypothetical protein
MDSDLAAATPCPSHSGDPAADIALKMSASCGDFPHRGSNEIALPTGDELGESTLLAARPSLVAWRCRRVPPVGRLQVAIPALHLNSPELRRGLARAVGRT